MNDSFITFESVHLWPLKVSSYQQPPHLYSGAVQLSTGGQQSSRLPRKTCISISSLGLHANSKEERSAASGDDLIIQMIGFQRTADVTPLRFARPPARRRSLFSWRLIDLDFHLAAVGAACSPVFRCLPWPPQPPVRSFLSKSGHRGGDLSHPFESGNTGLTALGAELSPREGGGADNQQEFIFHSLSAEAAPV